MQKLKISFTSLNEETLKNDLIIQEYDCNVTGNKITYTDNNRTNHEIIMQDDDLFINSIGEFDVKNHYNLSKLTKLKLEHIEKKQFFELDVKTHVLNINNSNGKIDISFEYDLFDGDSKVSDHNINIEVK